MGDQESVTERRLKGENELSGICHDFTHLCGDKVMNVNDRHLLDVQNASLMYRSILLLYCPFFPI